MYLPDFSCALPSRFPAPTPGAPHCLTQLGVSNGSGPFQHLALFCRSEGKGRWFWSDLRPSDQRTGTGCQCEMDPGNWDIAKYLLELLENLCVVKRDLLEPDSISNRDK
jgi:hypothetical protein